MKKILILAWKDFRITYRDITALLIIIAAPLAMTLVMNFAFSGSDTGFSIIPVGIINQDDDMLGTIFNNALTSAEVMEYVAVSEFSDLDTALAELEKDRLAAVILFPEGLSDTLLNPNRDSAAEKLAAEPSIELYPNLTRPVSVQIVEAIMQSILTDLNAGYAAGSISFTHLLQQGLVTPEQLSEGLGEALGQKLEPLFTENSAQISLETTFNSSENGGGFDWLSYMAPSMAILYLSFSMNSSARSILSEREKGTLPRLLISPNPPMNILAGKMMGTFLIGFTQVTVFIFLSRIVLGIHWGGIPQVFLFTITIVLAVASWGILIASLSRNSGEASAYGTAITLVFAALAGNFIPRGNFPNWLKTIGYVTPNAWGIEGYLKMIDGAAFQEMLPAMAALLGMAFILIIIASFFFRQQYKVQK